jgi:hypothetical protein
LTLLAGLTPTYALNLKGKHYNLSSGYSVPMYRDIINSRLYENLSVFLPGLPIFTLAYAKHNTRDSLKEHKINSTRSNIQLGMEDEIGPFRILFNRREYSLRDLARGPKYDVKSSDTSGDIDFTYFYRRLFFLSGRYGMGQIRTEQGATGEINGKTRDFSLNFRISPIPTIALLGMTDERREQRQSLQRQISTASSTNRIQLRLQPVAGILLNAAYSKSDTSQDEEFLSNKSKSLAFNVEPRQNLVFSGNFMVYDALENDERLSNLKRNSFDLRAELIEGLRLKSRIDLSKSEDFVSGFYSVRNNVTTILEVMPTMNLRTDISYDWQQFSRRLRDISDEEVRHRVAFAVNYSFARILNVNLRSGKDISSEWDGNTTFLNGGLNYLQDGSYINLRYNRVSRLVINPSSLQERKWITRALTVELGQEVGRNTDLRLSYESRLSDRAFGYRGMKRISCRANIRF